MAEYRIDAPEDSWPAFSDKVDRLLKNPTVPMRQFETGATRDSDNGKFDYEAFLSPQVVERYAAYMHKNRFQKDGQIRDGDNWTRGIPRSAYMKSMWRHVIDLWKAHRGLSAPEIEESLCAIIFNSMGYLYEVINKRDVGKTVS